MLRSMRWFDRSRHALLPRFLLDDPCCPLVVAALPDAAGSALLALLLLPLPLPVPLPLSLSGLRTATPGRWCRPPDEPFRLPHL